MKRQGQEASEAAEGPPAISIIIPSYRSRSTIGDTLRSVLDQRVQRRFEVVVVDSSDDDSADFIEAEFPRVRLLRASRRLFAGAARNRGAEESLGEILAFLDADAVAARDWLERLLQALLSRQETSMVGAAVADGGPKSPAGQAQYWIEFSEFHPGNRSGLRPNLPSCNFLIRRGDFMKVGGFDSRLAMSEDWDFSQRLGGGIYFEASTSVLHRQRSTWQEVTPHLHHLGYWSGIHRGAHAVEGSSLRRFPALTPLLTPLRLTRILRRTRRGGVLSQRETLRLVPALTRGLGAWRKGFEQGLKEAVAAERKPGE